MNRQMILATNKLPMAERFAALQAEVARIEAMMAPDAIAAMVREAVAPWAALIERDTRQATTHARKDAESPASVWNRALPSGDDDVTRYRLPARYSAEVERELNAHRKAALDAKQAEDASRSWADLLPKAD